MTKMAENTDVAAAAASEEAELAAEIGGGHTAPEPKPAKAKEEPAAGGTPERGPDGKFVKAEAAAKPDKDLDPFEDEAAPDTAPEEEAEPDKGSPAKKIEQQGYQIANLTKLVEKLAGAIEKQQANPTRANTEKVEDLKDDAEERIQALIDEGEITEGAAKYLRDLQKQVKNGSVSDDVKGLKSELSQMKAERDFDRKYPSLSGHYEKAVKKAWEAADEAFPNLPDSHPTKLAAAHLKLHDIAKAAETRVKGRKAAPAPSVEEPSPKPEKGARVATAASARPNQQAPKLSEAEEALADEEDMRRELGMSR